MKRFTPVLLVLLMLTGCARGGEAAGGLSGRTFLLAAFLRAGPTWRLSGDELVLDASGTSITFLDREAADPDRLLVGTEWTLDTLISGQVAGSVPSGVRAFITFADDGSVTGSGGCNQFGGRYEANGDTITFTEMGTTLMACVDDRGTVEGRVLEVVRGQVTYTIEAGHLTLTAADGKGLRFTAG